MHKDDPLAGQFQNPGYEYLKQIYLMKEAQAYASSQGASPHYFPLLALQIACRAIDEYVDLVGRQIDSAWDEINHEGAHIKERIVHIHKKIEKPVNFKKGIWKDVLALFDTTQRIHTNPSKFRNAREVEIPEGYRDTATKYPIHRSQAIAEEAVEVLLACSKGSDS